MLFFFLLTPPTKANPYDLFGKGNCAYFAYDMMDTFWPETFEVRRWWDAREWVELDGVEQGDYKVSLKKVAEVMPKDFIIIPASADNRRGHVSFVLGIDPEDRSVLVAESSNFANYRQYPYVYHGCRFRFHVYSFGALKDQGARVLQPEKI